jgi:multiple sugar transport system substrate-binding protein
MLQYQDVNPNAVLKKQETARADYEKVMSTQIGAGGGPDLLTIPFAILPTLAESGALEPLEGVLSAEEVAAMRPGYEAYQYDGKQFGYLWEANPYALFWNQELIDQAGITTVPTTFEELLSNANQVREKTGKIGFVARHQMNEETAWWSDVSNWPFGYGGSWSADGELTIDSPENIAAVPAFKKMYDSPAFNIGDDASTFRSKFAAGEVGYMIDNGAALTAMVSDNVAVPSTTVGAALLPFPAGGSAYAGGALGINAHSKNKELAKDFLRWLYSPEGQSATVSAHLPAAIATETEVPREFADANPWISTFYTQLNNSTSVVIRDYEEETPQISHIVLSKLDELLHDRLSPKEALSQAQKEAEALVGD